MIKGANIKYKWLPQSISRQNFAQKKDKVNEKNITYYKWQLKIKIHEI